MPISYSFTFIILPVTETILNFVLQNGNIDPVDANDWYHEDITKQEAAEKLAKGMCQGSF